MNIASGVRIGWLDLPADVRRAIEVILGDAVVEAVSQPGGFSPGTADRVRTADGRRAFVKAVSSAQNEHSPRLHRREAVISAALPSSSPAPRLLGSYDDGDWVALVLADVEGRHPVTPWQLGELTQVLGALDEMAVALTPSPVPQASAAGERLADNFAGWHRVFADQPADLDSWAAGNLEKLAALADRGLNALAGDTLVHTDLRADNLLLTPDGSVIVVDWPWACRGPAWLDAVLFLINVRLFGGHDTQALLLRCATRFRADLADLLAVLAGFAGYFVDAARQPPPPGLPTVREFQRVQGAAVLGWLAEQPGPN